MRTRTFALMLIAALLAGTVHTAFAGENPPPRPGGEYSRGDRDNRRGWRRDGPGRDDWRGGPGRHGFHGRDFDGPGGPGGMCGMGGMGFAKGGLGRFGHGMWDELDLTADQKAKFIDAMTENFRAGLEARMEMMEAGRKMRELRDDDTASAEDIVAAHKAAGEARGKMQVARRQAFDNMKNILTPEQIEKLDALRDGPRPPRFGDRRPDDRGPGGRPGPDGRRPPREPRMERGPGPRR